MDGAKAIDQLTIAELKFVCTRNELSTGGTKADLLIRLGEYFAQRGILASTVRLNPEEFSGTAGVGGDDTVARTRNDAPPGIPMQPAQIATLPHNPNSPDHPGLENRLVMLEGFMNRMAETMRRMELSMSRPTPEPASLSSPAVLQYPSMVDNHHSTSVFAPHPDRVIGTQAPPPPRALHQSILISYEDLRTARHSLPEFYGTTAEDPVRFLNNSESILDQARINKLGWTKTVEPQLKGAASTWWNTIKVLDLSWDEFRGEFLEKFDNAEIQSQLRADMVSVRQTSRQSLAEFILKKNQLARRITTGLAEPQLVGIIAGLTRDEYRVHLRLQQPRTFGDLRRIAGVLDPGPTGTPPPPRPKRDHVRINRVG